ESVGLGFFLLEGFLAVAEQLALLHAQPFERTAELEAAAMGGGAARAKAQEGRHERHEEKEGAGDSHGEGPLSAFGIRYTRNARAGTSGGTPRVSPRRASPPRGVTRTARSATSETGRSCPARRSLRPLTHIPSVT